MRIVNKKRFVLAMSILFILIISFCSLACNRVFSYTLPEYHKIIVSEGDTLWEIASKGEGNIDKNIYEIKKMNTLTSSCIYVGQELWIPFEY